MQEREQEPRIFLWTNRVTLIGGLVCILYGLVIAFSNPIYSVISIIFGIVIFIGRYRFNKYLDQNLDKEQISRERRCTSCMGTGEAHDADAYYSYGMSTHCRNCNGKGKYETQLDSLADCNRCLGNGYVWHNKRKAMCHCVYM